MFLSHFGLNAISDLPGLADLKVAGLLDSNLPPDFEIPTPYSSEELDVDEDALDDAFAEAEDVLDDGDDVNLDRD